MDATARGFHAQLLLLAARRKPAGTLPDDDLLWRKWLGLPVKVSPLKETQLSKAWMKACSEQGMPGVLLGAMQQLIETDTAADTVEPDTLADWLWVHRWKPMVLSAWERIDEDRIHADPRLAPVAGGWFNPIALSMAAGSAPEATLAPPATKKTRKGAKQAPPPASWAQQLDATGEAANGGLSYLDGTSVNLHDPKVVLARWRPEVDTNSRKGMWEMGVSCLVGANASETEKAKARSVLGKHIKNYGEEAVAKAVGQMAVRAVAPADAIAFLLGLLRQAEEGSSAQQAARNKRANLNL